MNVRPCYLLKSSSFSIKQKRLLQCHLVNSKCLLLFYPIFKYIMEEVLRSPEPADRYCNNTSFSTDHLLVYYTNNPNPALLLQLGLQSLEHIYKYFVYTLSTIALSIHLSGPVLWERYKLFLLNVLIPSKEILCNDSPIFSLDFAVIGNQQS